ncbi:hypothetical protein ACGFNU_32870 [Spirillospora sp. NPDC048911]|uniref:hypothetical protein n=1 Tax=Spirillospora sp. NPDC048911 TaxID=3364527 RepID=UPI00370FF502
MASLEEQIFLAVCTENAGAGVPHNLGPPFRNAVIARLWLSNYLAATAESLELDGDHDDLAALYRDAVGPMRKHGNATVGDIHYEIRIKPGQY